MVFHSRAASPECATVLYDALDFHLFLIGERRQTLASRMSNLAKDYSVVMLYILHYRTVINGNPFHWLLLPRLKCWMWHAVERMADSLGGIARQDVAHAPVCIIHHAQYVKVAVARR